MRSFWNYFLTAALCLLSFPLSAAVSIPDINLKNVNAKAGLVWENPSPIQIEGDWTTPAGASVTAISLVASYGADSALAAGTKLPIDLGNGLMLSLKGRIQLKDETTGSTFTWSSQDFRNPLTVTHGSVTQLTGGLRTSPGEGRFSFRGEVTPVVMCSSLPCQISSGKVPIRKLSIKLVPMDGNGPILGSHLAEKTVVFNGIPAVKTVCDFGITPTNIDFGTIRAKENGSLLAKAKSEVSAVCYRNEPGSLYIRLTPADGVHGDQPLDAMLSKPELGLRYNINEGVECSTSKSKAWSNEKNHLADLMRTDSETMTMNGKGTVHWGVCQRTDKVSPGKFSGTVNYDVWVD